TGRRVSGLVAARWWLRDAHGSQRSRADPLAHLTAVYGVVTKFLRDAEQLVVLSDPVRARERSGFDLARVGRDCNVGDGRVFGFPGAMRNDRSVIIVVRELDGIER